MLVVASALLVDKPVLSGVYDATIVASPSWVNVVVAVATPSVTVALVITSFPRVNRIVPPVIGFPSLVVTVAVSSTGVFVIIVSGTSIVVVVSIVLFSMVAFVGAMIVSSPYPLLDVSWVG